MNSPVVVQTSSAAAAGEDPKGYTFLLQVVPLVVVVQEPSFPAMEVEVV